MSDPATKSDLNELREQLRQDMNVQRERFNEDMKTHTGTLYEKFSGDVGLLSEQMTMMNKRLARVEKKMDVLTDTVGDMKVELTVVNEKLDRKADRSQITQLDRRVATLEAK